MNDCSFPVRLPLRISAVIAITLSIIACSDSTAPIPATKYIVTASTPAAVAGDTVIVKAQLADAYNRSIARSGIVVSWYDHGIGQLVMDRTVTDAGGVATNYYLVGTIANVTRVISVIDEDQRQGTSSPIGVAAAPPTTYAITASNLSPAAGATISITAQLTDKYGNAIPDDGRVVTWLIGDPEYGFQIDVSANRLAAPGRARRTSTTTGNFASPTSTTNDHGVATVAFNVGTTVNATYVIGAVDDQRAIGRSAAIAVQP